MRYAPTLTKKLQSAISDSDDSESELTPIDSTTNNGDQELSLHSACKENKYEIVKQLLEKNANPNDQDDNHGKTPLHYAVNVKEVDIRIIELLLEKGADPNIQDRYNKTPLHCATIAIGINPKIIKQLLEKRANPNIVDEDGNTPLHYAIKDNKESDVEILDLLIEKGANPNIQNLRGQTPLEISISKEEYFLIRKLADSDKDIDLFSFKSSGEDPTRSRGSVLDCLIDQENSYQANIIFRKTASKATDDWWNSFKEKILDPHNHRYREFFDEISLENFIPLFVVLDKDNLEEKLQNMISKEIQNKTEEEKNSFVEDVNKKIKFLKTVKAKLEESEDFEEPSKSQNIRNAIFNLSNKQNLQPISLLLSMSKQLIVTNTQELKGQELNLDSLSAIVSRILYQTKLPSHQQQKLAQIVTEVFSTKNNEAINRAQDNSPTQPSPIAGSPATLTAQTLRQESCQIL